MFKEKERERERETERETERERGVCYHEGTLDSVQLLSLLLSAMLHLNISHAHGFNRLY